MAIKNINKPIFTQYGEGDALTCPQCAKKVNMSIFENVNAPFDTFILGKKETDYFAVCPACAATFGVRADYIKERSSGTTVYMTESDLIKRDKNA